MVVSQELILLVEAVTSDGDFVELFDQKIDESKARKMMEAAMSDARALDYSEDEGTIVVSLQSDNTDDDLDAMETDFVPFSADCAVLCRHCTTTLDLTQPRSVKRLHLRASHI